MQLTEIVAHQRLLTIKNDKQFRYEILLEKSLISGLYRMGRRWAYLDDTSQEELKFTEWNMKYKVQYAMKLHQKLEMMNYTKDPTFKEI